MNRVRNYIYSLVVLSILATIFSYSHTVYVTAEQDQQLLSQYTPLIRAPYVEAEVIDPPAAQPASTPAPAPAPSSVATPTPAAPATQPQTRQAASIPQQQLQSLGYSLNQLQAMGINVTAHIGKVQKTCLSGPSGAISVQGLALIKGTVYKACANGQQPVPSSYTDGSYKCFVHYNSTHSNYRAILAHEVGHCLYFVNARYTAFDIEYKLLRPSLVGKSTSIYNEVMADDFMICRHGVDTNWPSNYHSLGKQDKPTAQFCSSFNQLINQHFYN